ncbi:MAG TPA: hypothetical protein VHS97_01755 [Isosphaeraceae bacterium]|nr:hypothetical protein [Isosphaeraceae bacterium]
MLLAINGLLAVLFVVTQLEPNQVAMLGPPGQYLHELFNPPAVPETSPFGKRLIAGLGHHTAGLYLQRTRDRGPHRPAH